ncbi:glutamine amidotransferase [Rhizobium sp. RAF36]|jgi:uncharacterized membrane protein|uniref:glutamine amidotransferase n=1 Tax=Rhizobium sp. RAF36 TaxID=3233055 RepID=UPI000DD64A5E
MKPVLLAGETFQVTSFASKGYEVSASARFSNGGLRWIEALTRHGFDVTQIGGERCESEFPTTKEQLSEYAAVVLSDVGALSLLYTPETRKGRRSVNRLELLRQWVLEGGSLMMAGGYCSFQGIDGLALFHDTAVDDALPVKIYAGPDGLEAPEGLDPRITEPDHPILRGITTPIPYLLGMNRVAERPQDGSTTLVHCDRRGEGLPLLAVRDFGKGRSLAWMSDIGPHWLSTEFMEWDGYDVLMANMVRWLVRQI